MNTRKALVGVAVFGTLLVLTGILPDRAFPQAPFYQGKTLTILAGTAPGGGPALGGRRDRVLRVRDGQPVLGVGGLLARFRACDGSGPRVG